MQDSEAKDLAESKEPPECSECGGELEDGECTDEDCPSCPDFVDPDDEDEDEG